MSPRRRAQTSTKAVLDDCQNSTGPSLSKDTSVIKFSSTSGQFLPRCMECRRGLAMGILSVRPSVRLSVRLSNACIVTKRKKTQSRFLYHAIDNLV